MDFKKELYPEGIRDKLENAVENSTEKFIEHKIDEENPTCSECGSETFEPKAKNSSEEFSEKAICNSCGNTISFDVEPRDLRSF